jgi:hypothetical protein
MTKNTASDHVNKPENEGNLHLVGVQESDFVLRDLPHRVQAHVVGVKLVLRAIA